MKAVDVVVPCYNYGRFLRGCVRTALDQDGVDVRVLIIDDCSPDDTAEVGRALAAEDPRVTFRRHEVNKGFFATINEGLFEWASADYCLLLSADDAVTPGALSRAVQLMEDHPAVGLTYGLGMILRGEAEPEGAPHTASPEIQIVPGARFLEYCCEVGNPVPTPTAVLRTRLQHELGPYDSGFPQTSDYDMWMRAALRADVGVINAVQGYYRWHGANMSAAYNVNLTRDLGECMRTVEKIVAEAGTAIARPEQLLASSRRRCARDALHEAHRLFEAGDAEGSRAAVAFAAEYGLSLNSPTGLTLQAKRVMGRGGYNLVRPALDALRGKGRQAHESVAAPGAGQPMRLIGLWPASA